VTFSKSSGHPEPNQLFAGKTEPTRVELLMGLHSKGRLTGLKKLTVTKTPAYYDTQLITALKSYITQAT
jgi:hypothetical protein